MTPTIWGALLTLAGAIAGLVAGRRLTEARAQKAKAEAEQAAAQAERTEADTAKVMHEMALSLLRPMQQQIDQLREENAALATDMAAVKGRLGMVEDDRNALAHAMRLHVAWEDEGRPDPPGAPTVAHDVRAILGRMHIAPPDPPPNPSTTTTGPRNRGGPSHANEGKETQP